MDGVASPADQQELVSSFLEITVDQSPETARQFLQASNWELDEAIQLFYTEVFPARSNLSTHQGVGGDNIRQGHEEDVLYDHAVCYRTHHQGVGGDKMRQGHEEDVLYDHAVSYREEVQRSGVLELENKSASTANVSRDKLADLFHRPLALMCHGTFKKAKDAAKEQDKWLLVNLQSTGEFSSHQLNRDTWANGLIADTIRTYFIFWQAYDDTDTEEVKKVSTCYDLTSIPVVLVINPVTNQKMWSRPGMIEPYDLLEDLVQFMDDHPSSSLSHKREMNERVDEDLARAMASSINIKPPTYPPLPRQPTAIEAMDSHLYCRVGMRLPYGNRIQRNFLLSDPIQLLWSVCWSELEEEDKARPFVLSLSVSGSEISLDFNTPKTFEEAGLAYKMINATWK